MKRRTTAGFACLAFLLGVPANAIAQPSAPQAKLTSGTVSGSRSEGASGAVFKGIPFAQPPVGALRWKAPLAPLPWQGVRDATHFGASCPQESRDGPGSEDCLTLNVWTPDWPAAPKARYPVMLWLYGGANILGATAQPGYDGAALAKRGVIVVSANYRVGVMGFMAHPALSAENAEGSSGNYGLLDQIAALRWVKDNIAQFGGDPTRVTVFGQSAGSYDILLLMTSPLAKGLFSGAIAESGQILSFGGAMPKARAEDYGAKLATSLDAPQGDAAALAYLRTLPPEKVMAAAAKTYPTGLASDTGLLTNVDGWVLPEAPVKVFARGGQMRIPLLIGSNAREIAPKLTIDALRQQIISKYGPLSPRALTAYGLANGGEGTTHPLLGDPAAQWMTDTVQRCPAGIEAEWHSASKNPTWRYEFELPVPGREAMGASHSAEIGFVFGTLENPAASDLAISDQIQRYWTRFAATGNPNDAKLPKWPDATAGRYLSFTRSGPVPHRNLRSEACGVYKDWAAGQWKN